jgi:aspartyl-tRNA(Asn)/glutamyl-tRNA(Gln) amidotransferase subunit B
MTELLRELKNSGREITDCPILPDRLAGLLKMIDAGTISGKIAKTVFEEMYRTGRPAEAIVKEKGLVQISDEGALEALIDEVLQAHPNERDAYRQGKSQLLGFFVGQVMKRSQGKANPGKVNELLKKKLSED